MRSNLERLDHDACQRVGWVDRCCSTGLRHSEESTIDPRYALDLENLTAGRDDLNAG